MGKQTTITIETRSLLVLCCKNRTRAWCPVCGARVEMVLLEHSGLLTEHAPAWAEWLRSGEVHNVESASGSSLICLDSLLARAQNSKPVNRAIPRLPDTEKERI